MVLLPAHGSELQITSVLPRPLSLQTGVLTRLDQVFFLDNTHICHTSPILEQGLPSQFPWDSPVRLSPP